MISIMVSHFHQFLSSFHIYKFHLKRIIFMIIEKLIQNFFDRNMKFIVILFLIQKYISYIKNLFHSTCVRKAFCYPL